MHAVKVAAFFGLFQAGMPLIGWALGAVFKEYIMAFDHWIAFGLLTIIGIKMIRESLTNDPADKKNILDNSNLIALSIATSIDALIVGVTLGIFATPLLLSIAIIGLVTFVLCFFGFLFGKKLGTRFGKRIEILGGIIVILIGLKILLEQLLH
jgi:putative Mn2+ efflux pump MntP